MKLRSVRDTPILAIQHMTTKIVFMPQLTYEMPKNVFDPIVKYCTIGPYLQSRRHQGRSLSLSRRGTRSQKRSVTRNCHQKRVWTQNKSTVRLKTVWNSSPSLRRVLICFEEATNQARSFRAAIETTTRIRPFHHYYTYGVARAVSNPGTPSIISMVGARWGICQHCALTRKKCFDFFDVPQYMLERSDMGVGEGPHNYAPYMGQSTKSIRQILHLPQVGHTIDTGASL